MLGREGEVLFGRRKWFCIGCLTLTDHGSIVW